MLYNDKISLELGRFHDAVTDENTAYISSSSYKVDTEQNGFLSSEENMKVRGKFSWES